MKKIYNRGASSRYFEQMKKIHLIWFPAAS